MHKRGILNIILAGIIVFLLIQNRENSPADRIKSIFEKKEAPLTPAQSINTHQKKSLGPRVALYPKPAVAIATYGEDGMPNAMAASWVGIANSKPLKISVSLRPATLSYHNIMKHKAFTVNIPNDSLASFIAFVGKYSGKDMNKFEMTGFTPIQSDSVDAPYIKEFPIVLECRMTEYHDLGSHRQFIGEVIDTKIDEHILNKNNRVDFDKFTPLFVGEGGYFRGGSHVGIGKDLRKVYEND